MNLYLGDTLFVDSNNILAKIFGIYDFYPYLCSLYKI